MMAVFPMMSMFPVIIPVRGMSNVPIPESKVLVRSPAHARGGVAGHDFGIGALIHCKSIGHH